MQLFIFYRAVIYFLFKMLNPLMRVKVHTHNETFKTVKITKFMAPGTILQMWVSQI